MTYKFDDEKVLRAIDSIIKDVDKKFDECLVEKFLEYIASVVEITPYPPRIILDRLKQYLEHRAFVMLNQTRAYKAFTSAALGLSPYLQFDMASVEEYFDALWSTIDIVVLNNNLSAITTLLQLFGAISVQSSGLNWLAKKEIKPPIKLSRSNFEIKDTITLLEYYLKNRQNYHASQAAEKFLKKLLFTSCTRRLAIDHSFVIQLKRLLRDLMIVDTTSVYCVLSDVTSGLKDFQNQIQSFHERYDILTLLDEFLDYYGDRPGKDLNNVCQLIASLGTKPQQMKANLDKLKSKKRLEAMIIYLARMESKHLHPPSLLHLLMTYTLYPILLHCNDDETPLLIQKLMATREERDFVERNMGPNTLATCLTQLKYIFEMQRDKLILSQKAQIVFRNTLTSYIKCHHKRAQDLRHILECCKILSYLEHFCGESEEATYFQTLQGLHETLDVISYEFEHSKPIVLHLISLIKSTHRKYTRFAISVHQEKIDMFSHKMVDLAYRYTDHDIMNEFALFFATNKFEFGFCPREEGQRYIKLIWEHMYQNAKETEHRELLGTLACLLMEIDVGAEGSFLKRFKIDRYHHVPMIVANILIERRAILLTIEKIISNLSVAHQRSNAFDDDYQLGYIPLLERATMGESVKLCLDRLMYGLCATVRGETAATTRLGALYIINDFVREIVINCDVAEKNLKRLVRTGILEVLYDVITVSLYGRAMYLEARECVTKIKQTIVKNQENASDLIIKLLLSENDILENKSSRNVSQVLKAEPIAQFYVSESSFLQWEGDECEFRSHNEIEPSSLVDDILNYTLLADGISDCY